MINSGRIKMSHLIALENSFRYIYCHPSDGSGAELGNVFHFLMKSSFDVRLAVDEIHIQKLFLFQNEYQLVTLIVRLYKDYGIANKDKFRNETFLHQ